MHMMTDPLVDMLVNRARKNRRKLKAWLKREAVHCYRLYDRDIPELPLAIDWYDGALHASVYQRKRPLEDETAHQLITGLGEALGVAPEDCHLKTRRRQKGDDQYEALKGGKSLRTVREAGLKFEVNLSDYLDTGLFLDHRPARAWVGAESAGKRVLNLFCYTGAFSIHAAAGDALETVSVDLSKTYLDWTARNLELNGFRSGMRHQVLRADALDYIGEAPRDYFDLVVLDPPTFSNSKSMDKTLDIQRDHRAMIETLRACLRPGGALYFSTNNRRFEMDPSLANDWTIKDQTQPSIPPDFRDQRVHKLWRLERP
jgi:23S rRNA G2069 N7-methylase RlmK/C1962 C5-methylase RlmI